LHTISIDDDGDSSKVDFPDLKVARPEQIRGVVDGGSAVRQVPNSQSERLAMALVQALEWPCGFGSRLQGLGAHYRHLPYRLGRSNALDAAVRCLLQSYTVISHGQPHDKPLELAAYCTAINALRQELGSPGTSATPQATTSETLCAALIIAQYELLRPVPSSSFVTLAGGVSAIFKGAGPGRVQSDFEQAIFAAQYPTIVTQAIIRGEKCFLSDPEWTTVMRRGNPAEDPIVTDLWITLTRLSGFLQRAREAGVFDDPNREASPLYPSLLRDAYALRKDVVQHAHDINRKLSHPGVHAICPAVYKGPLPPQRWPSPPSESGVEDLTPKRALRQSGYYHACVITANIVLQRILAGQNAALSLQTGQSAEYILATLDFVTTVAKPLGAMHMTFAGPMAYGVSGPAERRLLLEKLNPVFLHVGFRFDHGSMMGVFDAFTGVRRETPVVVQRCR
jgi:hypothetical protein